MTDRLSSSTKYCDYRLNSQTVRDTTCLIIRFLLCQVFNLKKVHKLYFMIRMFHNEIKMFKLSVSDIVIFILQISILKSIL